MSLIYEPAGRAREYAALACNVYAGCQHQCIYCYAPSATFKHRSAFIVAKPRKNFIAALDKEAATFDGPRGQVLLSFTCDPYQQLDVTEKTTHRAIQVLHRNGFSVCTLTKGGTRALRDLDLFGAGDAFATSLTLLSPEHSAHWEPEAALPADRIAAIKTFHAAGIPTWVSLEPVINPASALEIISQTHEFVDLFKVGKLNQQGQALPEANALAKKIDWRAFGLSAIQLLESLGYHRQLDPDAVQSASASNPQYYIKRDLAVLL